MKLLIPSAKLVPLELQNVGKLPAIIYPVNQETVFDYLYKQYKENVEKIEVLCYENSDMIHRRLSAYTEKNDNYSGREVKNIPVSLIDLPQLGDLGKSIYYGLSTEHSPIIINFADTIVSDNLFNESSDSYFFAEDYPSATWTFFEETNGIIKNIYDKKCLSNDKEKLKKLFVGVFRFSDAGDLKKCLKDSIDNPTTEMNSFYAALLKYSIIHPMKAVKTEHWFDIGHLDKYYASNLEVKARTFNHITIDKNRGILRKSSDDKEKFIGEIQWYLKLPSDVEYARPRIFSYSLSYENPYVAMEYYDYHTVHELFLYGDLTSGQWRNIFKRIKFICDDFGRYTVKDDGIKISLEDMYLTKTLQRLNKLKKNDFFKPFFDSPIAVNNVKYKSLKEVCEVLKKIIPSMLYDVKDFSIIHGDLCFANIMIDSNLSFIKMIDPRGKFGKYDIYGDRRYELAKLMHSLDGKYDFIIKDLFIIENKGTQINYKIQERKRDYDLLRLFEEEFNIGQEISKIELIESLLFLSMIPLHTESKKHQMAMLATGLEILSRVADIKQ